MLSSKHDAKPEANLSLRVALLEIVNFDERDAGAAVLSATRRTYARLSR